VQERIHASVAAEERELLQGLQGVIGAVGRVITQVADGKDDLPGPEILKFIKEHVDIDGSLAYKARSTVNPIMRRVAINHA